MKRLLRTITHLFSIPFALALAACGDVPAPTTFPTTSNTVGFAAGPDLAEGRFLHASVALPDGRVVVAGGFVGPGEDAQQTVEVFTPSANLWASGPPMQDPRYAHQMVLLPDGSILAMGGQKSTGYLATAELFNPQLPSSAWEKTKSMREPRIHFTATTMGLKNIVLVAGGISDVQGRSEWFDAAAAQWLPQVAPLPMLQSRSYHASVPLQNGTVLVTGGQAPAYVDTTEIFDPVTNMWTAASSMHVRRATHTLTLLRDGRAIAIGGATDNGVNTVVVSSAEVFDPISGVWTDIAPMVNARTGHQATLLMGGRRLLVTGGHGAVPEPIVAAEILDTETMQWAPAGNLVAPRFWHTAHLVQSDGRVLLVGGVNGLINGKPPTVVKTELFTPPCASNLECAAGYYCALEGVCAHLAGQSN